MYLSTTTTTPLETLVSALQATQTTMETATATPRTPIDMEKYSTDRIFSRMLTFSDCRPGGDGAICFASFFTWLFFVGVLLVIGLAVYLCVDCCKFCYKDRRRPAGKSVTLEHTRFQAAMRLYLPPSGNRIGQEE
ncbi:hypothetical protein QBC39DRAFT_432830 [Podospora conica]|nr:hypothetical protein QBC39DRAFT_432830 [Schizothecium conicum]